MECTQLSSIVHHFGITVEAHDTLVGGHTTCNITKTVAELRRKCAHISSLLDCHHSGSKGPIVGPSYLRPAAPLILSYHGYFNEVYALELHMEGEGDTLPSLEACLSLYQDMGTMGLRLKRRVEGPRMSIEVSSGMWTRTAPMPVLKSLVPALVGKYVYYSVS